MKTKLFFAFAAFCCLFLAYGTYQGWSWRPRKKPWATCSGFFMSTCPRPRSAFTLFFVNFLASIFYLWKRSAKADALAATTAEVGVVFCTVVLITGPHLGALCVGSLVVAMGHAPEHHAHAVAAVRELSHDAPLFDGWLDFSVGGSAGDLCFPRCADCLHGQPLVPHAPSVAHDRHAQPRSPDAAHHVHQYAGLPLLRHVDRLVPL